MRRDAYWDLYKPRDLPSDWVCSPLSGGYGGPCRSRPDLKPIMEERAKRNADERGYSYAAFETLVPVLDNERLGPLERGYNRKNASPAWDYERGCWKSEEGSPIKWKRKTLRKGEALVARRNDFLLKQACDQTLFNARLKARAEHKAAFLLELKKECSISPNTPKG